MAQFPENSLDGLHKLKHTVAMYLSNFVSNYLSYPSKKTSVSKAMPSYDR